MLMRGKSLTCRNNLVSSPGLRPGTFCGRRPPNPGPTPRQVKDLPRIKVAEPLGMNAGVIIRSKDHRGFKSRHNPEVACVRRHPSRYKTKKNAER